MIKIDLCRDIREQKNELQQVVQDCRVIVPEGCGGFKQDHSNVIFDELEDLAKQHQKHLTVYTTIRIENSIRRLYPSLNIINEIDNYQRLVEQFANYRQHPDIELTNFVCSFNGSPHVGRKLLLSALDKRGWINPDFVSKNFVYTQQEVDGHVQDLSDDPRLHIKFYMSDGEYAGTFINFEGDRFDHARNIYQLGLKLTKSFLHLVSEQLSTTYYPLPSEKFLYSIVTRGVWVANAQPNYHGYIEKNMGFKKYNHIFDYAFDTIQNPIVRQLSLLDMLSKFERLSKSEWHDLYEMERDTIEFNYDHYFSKRYLKVLADRY